MPGPLVTQCLRGELGRSEDAQEPAVTTGGAPKEDLNLAKFHPFSFINCSASYNLVDPGHMWAMFGIQKVNK